MNYWVKIRELGQIKSPSLNRSEKLYFALLAGFFVFLFLLFFQPFGVNNYDARETIGAKFFIGMTLMWGAITFLTASSELWIFPAIVKYLRCDSLLLWIFWSLWWMGSGVFLFYNFLGEWHDFRLSSYFEFLANVSILGLFPLAGLFFYHRFREMHRTLSAPYPYPHPVEDAEKLLVFTAENQKDQLSLPLKQLVFIESDDNYVFIHHLQDERVVKTLFRKNLKSIQAEVRHPALLRCHRSYLINLNHLQRIQGNRNKLLVFLNHIPTPIPVSRQYADEVLTLLSHSPQID